MTYRHLREWRAAGQTFTHSALVGSHTWNAVLEGRGEPTRLNFAGASADFFDAARCAASARPRVRRRETTRRMRRRVIVLNHGAWVRRFGGDPSSWASHCGSTASPSRSSASCRAGFDYPHGAEFWQPAMRFLTGAGPKPNLTNLDTVGVFYVVGRLRPGLDAAATAREIDELEKRLDAAQPGRIKWGDRAVVESFREHTFGAGPAGAVDALGRCRRAAADRLRERLRSAAHARLAAAARAEPPARARRVTRPARPAVVPRNRGPDARRWFDRARGGHGTGVRDRRARAGRRAAARRDRLNPIVVTFTFLVIALTALLCGLMPMRHAGSTRLTDALSDGARTTAGRQSIRMRSALLVAQMALAVVMLVAAGLVVRSFTNLRTIDLGFNPANVLSLRIEQQAPKPAPNQFMEQALERVAGSARR